MMSRAILSVSERFWDEIRRLQRRLRNANLDVNAAVPFL